MLVTLTKKQYNVKMRELHYKVCRITPLMQMSMQEKYQSVFCIFVSYVSCTASKLSYFIVNVVLQLKLCYPEFRYLLMEANAAEDEYTDAAATAVTLCHRENIFQLNKRVHSVLVGFPEIFLPCGPTQRAAVFAAVTFKDLVFQTCPTIYKYISKVDVIFFFLMSKKCNKLFSPSN